MPEYDVEALLDEISDLKGEVGDLTEQLARMVGLVEEAISEGETWIVGTWNDCASSLREAINE